MNIYISGPITGISEASCELLFTNAVLNIQYLGHFAVSPWHISKLLPKTFSHDDYMAIDIEMMKRCDAVYFIGGWEDSNGCKHERSICEALGIRIFDSMADIPNITEEMNKTE